MNPFRKLASFAPPGLKDAVRQQMASLLGVPYPRCGIPGELVSSIALERELAVVDVGAHQGRFAASIDQLCGIRKAVLCEPNPGKADELRRQYADSRYEIFQGAICACDGDADFYVARFDAISSLLPVMSGSLHLAAVDTSCESKIRVRARTLDSLLKELRFGVVDLLKIDVQGAEILVLEGATETLTQTARIWVEVSLRPLYEGSALFPEVYGHLVERGFSLQALEPGFRGPNGELLQLDLLFLSSALRVK